MNYVRQQAHAYFLLSKAWRIFLEEMPVPTHAHLPPSPSPQGPLLH